MKRWVTAALLLLVAGAYSVVDAQERSAFALFNGTNVVNTASGALCIAEQPKEDKAFTYYLTVTNHGAPGVVQIKYLDGNLVEFAIPALGSFSLTQAAGMKGGADKAVRVSNGGSGAVLVGAMSALSAVARPSCLSCDEPAAGGAGDAACDAIVPN